MASGSSSAFWELCFFVFTKLDEVSLVSADRNNYLAALAISHTLKQPYYVQFKFKCIFFFFLVEVEVESRVKPVHSFSLN